MSVKLGKDAVIYIGAAGTAIATLADELDGVADVTLNLSAAEADVTTRASGGWKNTAATLRDCELSFDMPVDTADATGYQALRAAFIAGTNVSLCALTGAKTAAGNEGPDGDWCITGFERAEPLGDKQAVSVTAKLAAFRAWHVSEGAG